MRNRKNMFRSEGRGMGQRYGMGRRFEMDFQNNEVVSFSDKRDMNEDLQYQRDTFRRGEGFGCRGRRGEGFGCRGRREDHYQGVRRGYRCR